MSAWKVGKLSIKQQMWLSSTHIRLFAWEWDLQSWRQRLTLKLLKYPLGFSSRTSVGQTKFLKWSDIVWPFFFSVCFGLL